MALRNPIYLDSESLLAHAEYNEINIPVQAEIVETTVSQRGGKAQVGYGPLSAGGAKSSEVELQSSYVITPSQKATVSKVIDSLIHEKVVSLAHKETAFVKDDLIEIDGITRITVASLVGKIFNLLLQYMKKTDLDVTTTEFSDIAPELKTLMQKIYLGNELVPVPVLAELEKTGLSQKVFVNVRPNHFIDDASIDRLEGERQVLGTVRNLIDGSPDGFLSSEEWLLYGWEHLMKRKMMANLDDELIKISEMLELDLPEDDVHAWVKGPAIIIDAIAIY